MNFRLIIFAFRLALTENLIIMEFASINALQIPFSQRNHVLIVTFNVNLAMDHYQTNASIAVGDTTCKGPPVPLIVPPKPFKI